jgi:site-specific DNA recombinase
MKPAIIYAAKSTTDVHGSIPDQIADGRKLAADRDFEVVADFQDEAASAYHGDRGPGLAKALSECERLSAEHGSSALIVQHSDRLARGDVKQARHLIELVVWAIKSDVQLLSVQDPEMLAGGEMGLLMGVIGGMRNHQDSKRKGLAVKGGIRRRAVERRQFIGGRRPFGYRHRDTTEDGRGTGPLVIDKAEAAIVRRVFAEYVAGRAQNAIAQDLEREGVPTLTPAGAWYATTVAGMLKNPLYIGMVTHDGEGYPAEHEPIIDRETWEKAIELREARTAQGRPRGRRTAGRHLLTEGLLRCTCGAAMSPVTKRDNRAANGMGYETYACVKRLHHGRSACAQTPIRRELIDNAIYNYFETVALDVDSTRDLLAKQAGEDLAGVDDRLEQAESELAKAEATLERIEGDYIAGQLTAEKWSRLEDRLRGEAAAARAEADQHRRQRKAVEARMAEFDAEAAMVKELAALRQLVAGEVQAGRDGKLEQLRSVLRRLFDYFELTKNGPSEASPSGYSLRPLVRFEHIEAVKPNGAAVYQRVALDLSDNLCSLLAAW